MRTFSALSCARQVSVSVPTGARATVSVPTFDTPPARAALTEGGVALWVGGAFVPGAVPGVVAAAAAADGRAVQVWVGAGDYVFEVEV